jgi:hypothetical protein
MSVLKNDGDSTFLVIQHQTEGRWVNSNLDSFKFFGPLRKMGGGHLAHVFSAGGACHQQTGINGCLDKAEGLDALAVIARSNPGTEFRLVRLHLSQRTECVATATVNEPVDE